MGRSTCRAPTRCSTHPGKEPSLTTEADPNGEFVSESAAAPPPDEQELQEETQTELSMLSEAARFATPERTRAVVEALLFAAEKPLDLETLRHVTQMEEPLLKEA